MVPIMNLVQKRQTPGFARKYEGREVISVNNNFPLILFQFTFLIKREELQKPLHVPQFPHTRPMIADVFVLKGGEGGGPLQGE
jgi:hypothetical protein